MHSRLYFSLFAPILLNISISKTMEEKKIEQTECNILNVMHFKDERWSYGKYLYSKPINNRIFTCYSGNIQNMSGNMLAQNPLCLIDTTTGINTIYNPIQEINNESRVSAIHQIIHHDNSRTMIVGHETKVYLLQEQLCISDYFKILFSTKERRSLKKIKTISPQLGSQDFIHTIDSSKNHLLSISSQGYITRWNITNNGVEENNPRFIQYDKKFFSSGINQQEQILCLGLENGQLFVLDIPNFTSKTLSFFTSTKQPINWINSYENQILFACLHNENNTYQSQYTLLSDASHTSKDPSEILCCKQHNLENLKNKQQTTHDENIKKIRSLGDKLQKPNYEQALKDLEKNNSKAIKKIEETVNKSGFMECCENDIPHALIPATLLKNKAPENIPDTSKKLFLFTETIKEILNKNKGAVVKKIVIKQIHLYDNNQAVIFLEATRNKQDYSGLYAHSLIGIVDIANPTSCIFFENIFNRFSTIKKLYVPTDDGFTLLHEYDPWNGNRVIGSCTHYNFKLKNLLQKLLITMKRLLQRISVTAPLSLVPIGLLVFHAAKLWEIESLTPINSIFGAFLIRMLLFGVVEAFY